MATTFDAWDFGNGHVLDATIADTPNMLTCMSVARCGICNQTFTAVSSNPTKTKRIIRSKHTTYVKRQL